MALMLLALMIGFGAIVVDVGLYLHSKEQVQGITDAVALAGAQELPDDRDAALAAAEQWAVRNGVDPADMDISFECRASDPAACQPSGADTIIVSGGITAPVGLMRILKLFGSSNCWTTTGCTAEATAAAEARSGAKPIDIGLILDRTSSMDNRDLDNVQDGALDMLTQFDPDFARVALGVLGPSRSLSDRCRPSPPPPTGAWLPVSLSNDYQTPSGALNNSSLLVSTINCVTDPANQSSVGTNLGSPFRAAMDHLLSAGDPNADKAIILLTDGEANDETQSTGFLNCGSQAPVTSGSGDNNGYEQLASQACSDGVDYARDMNSGSNTSTSCGSSGKDRHRFGNYGITLPAGASVTGIDVRLDAAADSSSGTSRLCVELSSNGGSSWTSARNTSDLTSSFNEFHLGDTDDSTPWGRSWTAANLANGNFMVRVTDVSDSSSRDFFLDYVAVNVFYADNTTGGPCGFAAKQADLAKALIPGVQIFTIGYGVAGARCTEDTGSWHNDRTEDLLRYMASAPENVFIEPRTEDLSDVFREIGRRLSAGYRLVQ
jgi:Flp pilus assembly protein TadG